MLLQKKGLRGLKIHKAMSTCGLRSVCTCSTQTLESPSQEASHSTGDFSVTSPPTTPRSAFTDAAAQTKARQDRLSWMEMFNTEEWANFDEDEDRVLEVTQSRKSMLYNLGRA